MNESKSQVEASFVMFGGPTYKSSVVLLLRRTDHLMYQPPVSPSSPPVCQVAIGISRSKQSFPGHYLRVKTREHLPISSVGVKECRCFHFARYPVNPSPAMLLCFGLASRVPCDVRYDDAFTGIMKKLLQRCINKTNIWKIFIILIPRVTLKVTVMALAFWERNCVRLQITADRVPLVTALYFNGVITNTVHWLSVAPKIVQHR